MTRRHAIRRAVALASANAALTLAGKPERRVTVIRLPEGATQPQVARDEVGMLHLLYYSGAPRAGDLFYVRSRDGGVTFSRPLRVNESGSAVAAGTIRGAQMALGAKGQVHVAWNGSPAATVRGPLNPASGETEAAMLYTRLNSEGTAFEPERNLMVRSHGLDGGGSVAADPLGNVYVFWHGLAEGQNHGPDAEARRRVWVTRSSDGGRVFAPEQPAWREQTGACGCCGMKAIAGDEGRLYALYRSAAENVHRDIYLLRSTDRGQTFAGKLLHKWEINACPMSSMDFGSNAKTTVAAWETGGQVLWTAIDRSSGQTSKPIEAPGDGMKRKHPRVALNSRGEILLAWTEGTGWQKGGSLAWQLFDPSGRPGEAGSAPGVPVWSFAAPAVTADGTFTILY